MSVESFLLYERLAEENLYDKLHSGCFPCIQGIYDFFLTLAIII